MNQRIRAVRQTLLLTGLIAATLPAMAQSAKEGDWLVRVRAVQIDTDHTSEPIPSLAVPGDAIQVSNKTIPEIDFTRFFSKNLAAELILTYPQKHNLNFTGSAVGSFNAGTFKHLPPTLTLQWHFAPDADYRPYLGVGLNYTRFSSVNLRVPGVTNLHVESNSVGGALQAGIDIKLGNAMFLNFDLKKVQIRTDVFNDAGVKVSHLRPDPVLFGVGLGYRF
jgi:outer membrane protein